MDIKKLTDFDLRLTEILRLKPQQKFLWGMAAFLAHSGDSWYWLAALFIIWLVVKGFWHNLSALLAIAILILALLVFAIKLLVRRKRPAGDWGEFYRRHDPHSFPSGHAARSFLLIVLSIGLGPWWFALIICIWAPLVALARILMGVHFLSDVVVGSIIGILWGIVMLITSPLIIKLLPFIFT